MYINGGNMLKHEQMFYINENERKACELTGLELDEIEMLVGRFANHSHRKGLLRGKVVVLLTGEVQIRKCFGNKLIWTKD
jgi:hypothetical protein